MTKVAWPSFNVFETEALIELKSQKFYSLRFPKQVEMPFRDFYFQQRFRPSSPGIWFGVGIFYAFLGLDYLSLRQHFPEIFMVRTGIAIACLVILSVMRTSPHRGMSYIGSCLGIVLINAGVIYVDILGMREGTMGFPVGTLFVSLFVSSIMAIPFYYTVVTLLLILSSYAFSMMAFTQIGDGIVNLSLLFGFMGLTGSLSSYQREYEARREFLQEMIIQGNQRSIQAMLDNVPEGIFTLRHDLTLTSWSKRLSDLVGHELQKGLDFSTWMEHYLDLSNLQKTQILSTLRAAIDQPLFSFQINEDKLPLVIHADFGSGPLVLEVSWNPLLVGDMIAGFLITHKDITNQIAIQNERNRQDQELRLLGMMLSHDSNKLISFFKSAFHNIQSCLKILRSSSTQKDYRVPLIHLHTLKGSAGTLGFHDIENMAHKIEDDMKKSLSDQNQEGILRSIEELSSLMEHYQHIFQRKIIKSHTEHVLLTKSRLDSWLQRIKSQPDEDTMSAIGLEMEATLGKTLVSFIEDWKSYAGQLAATLGKESPNFTIKCPDSVLVNAGWELLLESVFLHLIRNSMDHGLETAPERISQGKSKAGTLSLEVFIEAQGQCRLTFTDDGRGLAIDRLRAKWTGNPEDIQGIADLIFQSGVSTASAVTAISGRGVGMDAVRSLLEEQNASIVIVPSQVKNGFMPLVFVITLPKGSVRRIATSNLNELQSTARAV